MGFLEEWDSKSMSEGNNSSNSSIGDQEYNLEIETHQRYARERPRDKHWSPERIEAWAKKQQLIAEALKVPAKKGAQ